jgi:hypothetical protein
MKSFISILILLFVVLITSCDKKQEQNVEELSNKSEAGSMTATTGIPKVDDDYLAEIYELQERIKLDHQNIELRKSYCQKAYFPESGQIISMGIGLLNNPKTGQAIPKALAERVALIDAARWVGYIEVWLEQQYQPDFGKLNKQVNLPLQVINQITLGDSLFVFFAAKTNKH